MPMTTYMANKLANAAVANVAYTSTTVYMSLFSAAPTVAGGGTEITGNGYSRQLTTFATPSNGVITNTGNVTFSCTGNNWPTVVSTGVHDASTGGNLLFFTAVASRNVKVSDTLIYGTGNVSVKIA